MSNMQIARTNFVSKTRALSTVARNASCSRGWLRLVVQTIFALITVASFVLIVIMAMQNPSMHPVNRPIPPPSRCYISNCRVFCRETPYFGEYEDNIINIVASAEIACKRINLVLNGPTFINSTMPASWMSKIRTDCIHELSIIRGNLMHIAPGAFMSNFAGNIRTIVLEGVSIRTLGEISLVGLFSLENLLIKDSNIIEIQSSALRAVDDTLQSLTVTRSNHWNPVNVTGTTEFVRLSTVDLSSNVFSDILDSRSFIGLERCKIIFLNSCKITALGSGTFDHLRSIDIIYLNNNLLVTVPPGLFINIMSTIPKPRINLQDNFWHCDCSSEDLRSLVRNKWLYVEPLCHYPTNFRYKTFTEFENYCESKECSQNNFEKRSCNKTSVKLKNNVYVNGSCYGDNTQTHNVSFRMLSPLSKHTCSTKAMNNINMVKFITAEDDDKIVKETNLLRIKLFFKTDKYSVVQMDSSGTNGYGLMWYQSTCPKEVYCLNILPNYLIVYNVDLNARYTFCPVETDTGAVEVEHCIGYDTSKFDVDMGRNTLQVIMYVATGFVCLVCGALCVYALIRKNPSLLKGSKRILFVKHKTVDALVLPPKIPLRNSLTSITPHKDEENNIFIVSRDKTHSSKFSTLKSVRSNNSNSPSYISALQPTDDQLAEWRIHHHFNNDLTLTSTSDISLFSWIYKGDSLYYSIESEGGKA